MAKLVALRALPNRYFAIPLLFLLALLSVFVGIGRIYGESSSSGSRGWSALLGSIEEVVLLFPLPLLMPLMIAILVAGALSGVSGVLLGRLFIEQDYLNGSALDKEPYYWDGFGGPLRTRLTLGWPGLGAHFITAAGLGLFAFGAGSFSNVDSHNSADPLPTLALAGGGLVVFAGLAILNLLIRLEREEWHHEPLPVNTPEPSSEPAGKPHQERQERRGLFFWKP